MTIKRKDIDWIVYPDHGEEFTELLFVAGLHHPGLYAEIGICDEEGMQEYTHKYWWKAIAGEQGWIDRGAADTFKECATAALDCIDSFAQEIADLEREEQDAAPDSDGA